MCAMIISEKIPQTSIIFTHLVKSIDNHCSVSDIASEVQRYLDRGHNSDTTTILDSNVMCAHKSQRTGKSDRHPNDSDQVLRIRKHLCKTNTHNSRPSNQKQTHRHASQISLQKLHEGLRMIQGSHISTDPAFKHTSQPQIPKQGRFLHHLRKMQGELKWQKRVRPSRSCLSFRTTTESCAVHKLHPFSAFAESSTRIRHPLPSEEHISIDVVMCCFWVFDVIYAIITPL